MKCYYCGAEIADRERFCPNCGTRQTPESRQEPEEAVTPWTIEEPAEQMPPIEPVAKPQPPVPQPVPERRRSYVPFGVPAENYRPKAPALQLPTERGLAKMVFLGILTLGIYPTVIWSRIVTELNLAASRYDGARTMSYFGMCLLAPITLMIYPIVWFHCFCRRVGAELERRGIQYKFGASAFWLWNVLGSLILVGPFIFVHKLMKAMNMINKDFNVNG